MHLAYKTLCANCWAPLVIGEDHTLQVGSCRMSQTCTMMFWVIWSIPACQAGMFDVLHGMARSDGMYVPPGVAAPVAMCASS